PRPVCLELAGPVVGTVARLVPGKRVDLLIEAFAARVPHGTLVIVGDGPERASLEALAAQRGVDDRVVFAGWRDDAVSWCAEFDVFVLPSDAEGVPLTVIEAMYVGTPVVATRVGSVADAVQSGATGILVAPGDPDALGSAVVRLLEDPGEGARLARAARDHVERHFSATACASSFSALYDQVSTGRTWWRRAWRDRESAP
ncbi:MAG TPA: glycosyltransferase, partial [Candidatus Limnocylindrales bacterium]